MSSSRARGLKTGIRSKKCVVRRLRHCVKNSIALGDTVLYTNTRGHYCNNQTRKNPNTLEHVHQQLAAPQSFTTEIVVSFSPALRKVKYHSSNTQCTHRQHKCNTTDRQRHRNQNARKLRQNQCIAQPNPPSPLDQHYERSPSGTPVQPAPVYPHPPG